MAPRHSLTGHERNVGVNEPIAFSSTLLLGLLWISSNVAGFGEVAGKVSFWLRGTVSKADVVTVIEFVGTSHCSNMLAKRQSCRFFDSGSLRGGQNNAGWT